ncbi:MAG: lipopolysaccharide biosynthesis protein RfbH [Candidatus Gastranaerophilales bacterium]|nr:lipopolysaccharide biosynthesis protein RfbH [Candidatus Gastranaerophilales bacterium]
MEKILRELVKITAKIYFKLLYKKNEVSSYIPVSGKFLDEKDLCNIIDASLDLWLTAGRFNDQFEKKFAQYLDVKYAITTNSGSSANLLAISALTSWRLGDSCLKPGDEVITVAAGFPTTVTPIIQNGLVPVFIDCELESYNIDVSLIEEAITTKTKAIFIAHTLGSPFNLSKIKKICDKHKLWLIEDSCDALGATYEGQNVGTIGHIGTFSFYPAHHITMGEGGAVVTNDPKLNKILKSFRDWGRDCCCPPGKDNICKKRFDMQLGNLPHGYDHKYTYSHVGYNLKITDWQAANGVSQLEKLPVFLQKRKRNALYLLDKLQDLNEYFILPSPNIVNVEPSWFGFLISVRPLAPFSKQELVEHLENNNIATRQLFAGNILRQPMMTESNIPLRIGGSQLLYSDKLVEEDYSLLPNTDFVMNHTFWVGTFPALKKEHLDKISNVIHDFVGRRIS